MNERKRICCFCECWESGGIESFLCNVLTRMDFTNLEVDVVAPSIGESVFTTPLKQCGVHFIELPYNQRNFIRNHRMFRKLIRERKYNVFHLNAFQGLSMAYLRIAKQEGVPVRIAHSHNTGLRKSLTRALKLVIHAWSKNRYTIDATDLWSCSRIAAEFLFDKREMKKRGYRFIPNGIDTEKFRFNLKCRIEDRIKLGIKNSIVIGSVGRLCYQKNQSFLLDIFAEVLKHNPNCLLLVVGEGEDRVMLEEKTQRLGIADRVLFYGTTNHIERLLWVMDIFLFPSRFEGLGIAAVEAQAAGLPVICSKAVPDEARVTEHVYVIPLSDGAVAWSDAILGISGRFPSVTDVVKMSGFDISDVAKSIESFYLR